LSFGKRLPFTEGRPFWWGWRGSTGAYKAASKRNRLTQSTGCTSWIALCNNSNTAKLLSPTMTMGRSGTQRRTCLTSWGPSFQAQPPESADFHDLTVTGAHRIAIDAFGAKASIVSSIPSTITPVGAKGPIRCWSNRWATLRLDHTARLNTRWYAICRQSHHPQHGPDGAFAGTPDRPNHQDLHLLPDSTRKQDTNRSQESRQRVG
jgi:hypothetical protein